MENPASKSAGPASPPTSTTLGRRERKKQEVRRKIFEAAFDLFREKGFEDTTVEEIAERADVGKGTVFNYFPRKTSFLAALTEDWMARLNEELGPVESWEGTTREKFERMFQFMADLSIESPDLARQALFEKLRQIQDPKNIVDKPEAREFRAMTRTVLNDGQASDEVRGDVEIEHAATLLESAMHRTLALWLIVGGTADDLHEQISAKLDIIFYGLAAKSAAKARGTNRGSRKR